MPSLALCASLAAVSPVRCSKLARCHPPQLVAMPSSPDAPRLLPLPTTGGAQPVPQVHHPQPRLLLPAPLATCFLPSTRCAQVVSSQFTKSVIRSRAALTYAEAQSRIDDERLTDDLSVSFHGFYGRAGAVGVGAGGWAWEGAEAGMWRVSGGRCGDVWDLRRC